MNNVVNDDDDDNKVMQTVTPHHKGNNYQPFNAFKTLVTIYQSTWCNIPEDLNFKKYCCKNLKSTFSGYHF